MDNLDLSESEKRARKDLIETCKDIADDYYEEDDNG